MSLAAEPEVLELLDRIYIIDQGDRRLQVFGSVNNLFNHAPPVDPQLAYSTNPIYFDQVGRYYRLGLRFNY